ncbi:hypothetical protein D7Y11_14640 [Corallococcus sp. AB018]|nr:hypothetical protein D7V77_13500 [Corallococcus sp. CA041A]RUO92492.1 hypothetical protein D7Y11_14640 [Corallococcus sp. AB018]
MDSRSRWFVGSSRIIDSRSVMDAEFIHHNHVVRLEDGWQSIHRSEGLEEVTCRPWATRLDPQE